MVKILTEDEGDQYRPLVREHAPLPAQQRHLETEDATAIITDHKDIAVRRAALAHQFAEIIDRQEGGLEIVMMIGRDLIHVRKNLAHDHAEDVGDLLLLLLAAHLHHRLRGIVVDDETRIRGQGQGRDLRIGVGGIVASKIDLKDHHLTAAMIKERRALILQRAVSPAMIVA